MKILIGGLLTLLVGAGLGAAYDAHPADDAPEAGESRPYVLITRATPDEGKEDLLLDALGELHELTEGQAGVLEWLLLEPTEDGGEITLIAVWSNEEAFEAFHATDAFKHYHASGAADELHAMMKEFNYATYRIADGHHRPHAAEPVSTGIIDRIHRR